MTSSLTGKYSFDQAENLDAYLEALGVGQVLRKVQSVSKPSLEVTYMPDTEEWQITTESAFRLQTIRFKVGQSFEDETYDARKCRTTARMEGENKLVLEQVCYEGPTVVVTQEKAGVEPDAVLVMTMTAGEHKSIQRFKRVVVPQTD